MKSQATNVRWNIFALACGTSWMLYLHRYTFAAIKPELSGELSTFELGLMDSVFSACYALFQFPLGVAADTLGVHLVLTGLILLWTFGLYLHTWAPSVFPLVAARATLGIGQSAVFASLNRVARTWFPDSIRTTLQGWVGVSFGRLGGMCAPAIFGILLLTWLGLSWQAAIYVFVAMGLGHALLFAMVFRNSPRGHPLVNDAEVELIEGPPRDAGAAPPEEARPSIGRTVRGMTPRSLRNLLSLNGQTILSAFADNIYSNWIPLFLFTVHGIGKEMTVYWVFWMLPLLGGACGGALGGWLNDRVIRRTGNRRWARSGVGLAGKGMAALLLVVALIFYENPYLFCGMLFFVKLFGDWSLTSTWGTTADIGGRATASVFAFNNAVATIGAVTAPAVFSAIAEYSSWRVVFITAAVVYALCALTWLRIDCTIPVAEEV